MEEFNGKLEITGTGLKLIAVITMLIDHIGAGIIKYNELGYISIIGDMDLYTLLRAIGRMAFPIYCYMLVEGFVHTRNIWKYGLRLLAVAVISELPFNFLFYKAYLYPGHNNVLWTLLLGLAVMYGLFIVDKSALSPKTNYVLKIIIMIAGMALADLTKLDYKYAGICCIAVMYSFYSQNAYERLYTIAFGVVILTLLSSRLEVWAFFILIPFYFYKGHRGADSKALRTFFYLFYPVHLIALCAVRYFLNL
ncbi:MAG: TraX protein [Pseudobutyrivibrio sp.]|nr:TraX protein [Pseudobutyrivibrio sp.]